MEGGNASLTGPKAGSRIALCHVGLGGVLCQEVVIVPRYT